MAFPLWLDVQCPFPVVVRQAMAETIPGVVDDDGNFIGIVTRQEIIKYLKKQTAKVQEEAAEAISRAEAAEKELSELKNSGT